MLGQRLNNFEIVRSLGEGGMDAVYEAEHLLIRRKVAVKVLKPELALDAELVQRFFNEARATSAIRHPNIVEVIDVGRFADGVPYLVMELLEGESLAERLERLHTLEIADAIEVVRQSANALMAAHGAGIVHRDLKPENLFLVPDQRFVDRELVKVLDFGIAKLREDITTAPVHTIAGALFGTPPYMSPEQCRGLPDELDERTDIYALGVILYEALCGQPPFVSEGVGELMMMHMTTEPKPPSIYRPELPADVERVILRALAKRREDRFANMRELQAALSATVGRAATLPQIELGRAQSAAHGGEGSGEVAISSASNATDAPRTNGSSKKAPVSASPAKIGRILIAATLGALGLILATTSLHGSLRREPRLESTTSLASARTFTPPRAAQANVAATSGEASTLPTPPQPMAASAPQASLADHAPRSSALALAPTARVGAHHAEHLATKSLPPTHNHDPNLPPPPPSAAVPIAAEASAEDKLEPGYLSLDSAPWSEVFLRGTLLGTTPIMHVPLPPGRHLLTLKNSELGTSTSYMVEIKSGQTVSRLVGWEK